ncbi:peptidoglycan-binding protein [Streptomyces sp. SAJ15]|uniref:peptidoglycan-binding domain-containing protein n=1 Tax=Streptomyces sp. SAJ15 TaxID=2011095 RepID=UPI0011858074|nr:peptidoglycan-binding protein [Streptomyces sp. SAJ15]
MATEICNHTKTRPTIKRGSSGPAVMQAQCYLNNSLTNTNLATDGVFGPVTEHATHRFQTCADITVDGVIGAQTWSHLAFWANSPDFVC